MITTNLLLQHYLHNITLVIIQPIPLNQKTGAQINLNTGQEKIPKISIALLRASAYHGNLTQ